MGKGVGYKIYSRKCNPRDYKMDKHEERVHLRFLRLEAFLKGCFFFRSFIIIYFATMVRIVHRKGPCPMSFCLFLHDHCSPFISSMEGVWCPGNAGCNQAAANLT